MKKALASKLTKASETCDPPRTRTWNQLIKSQLLCQIELVGQARNILPESQTGGKVVALCPDLPYNSDMIPLQDINPSRTRPYVTWLLITANVLIFLLELTLDMYGELEGLIYTAGLVPATLTRDFFSPALLTVFSSMFLHGGWTHLLGNMLYLWIFGDNIEDRMGHGRYLVFYLLGGIAAAAAQTVIGPDSQVPMVGASGAIAAVLGAYLVEFPRARVRSLVTLGYFIRIAQVPAVIVLGMWFVIQFFSGFLSLSATLSGGVAYFAHIGGFVAGLLLVKPFTVGRPRAAYWDVGDLGRY
jgi:membrane associated rhomboid family serine protease